MNVVWSHWCELRLRSPADTMIPTHLPHAGTHRKLPGTFPFGLVSLVYGQISYIKAGDLHRGHQGGHQSQLGTCWWPMVYSIYLSNSDLPCEQILNMWIYWEIMSLWKMRISLKALWELQVRKTKQGLWETMYPSTWKRPPQSSQRCMSNCLLVFESFHIFCKTQKDPKDEAWLLPMV